MRMRVDTQCAMEGSREMISVNDGRRSELSAVQRVCQADLCPWISARYSLAILSFLGFFNVYALRVNLSVAILQMDNSTAQHYRHAARTFKWSDEEEGWILAAFFYGYVLTQIPGGWLAQRIGGKWVFGVGIVMTSIFTLLTPIAALSSVEFFIAVRVLEGFFEGVTFPAMQALWGKWAPPKERTRLATITYTGPYVGNILSFPLSALLCQYGFDGGWPSVFYVFGSVGVIWFIVWILLAHSTPADHPRISPAERSYIEGSLSSESGGNKGSVKTPWLHILTSPPVWGLMVAYFCTTWGLYTLLTCMPTFIKQTLGCSNNIPIVMDGVYSAIPYFFLAVFTILAGPLADYMRNHWFSTTFTRKLLTDIALIGSAIFLLLCGYFGNSIPLAITFLSASVGIGGFVSGGLSVNHLDISANHAGVLMGITNMCGTIPGFIGPQVAKLIATTPNVPKCSPEYISILRNEWREVFILSTEITVAGALIYTIIGSGEVQWWAKTPSSGDDITTTSPQMINDNEDANDKTPLLSHSKELKYSGT